MSWVLMLASPWGTASGQSASSLVSTLAFRLCCTSRGKRESAPGSKMPAVAVMTSALSSQPTFDNGASAISRCRSRLQALGWRQLYWA